MRVPADEQVLEHGRVLEQLDVLERAGDAEAGDLVRRAPAEVDAVELDRSRRRRVEPADEVEDRRLAGAVRADQREHLAARDVEGHAVDGADAAEADAEVLDREQRGHFSRSDLRKLFWRWNMPRR